MGNSRVIQAIKNQTDTMACAFPSHLFYHCFRFQAESPDIYNAQCSNEPAEELARLIVDGSDGAFELCGFVSGGRFAFMTGHEGSASTGPTSFNRLGGGGGSHQACSSILL